MEFGLESRWPKSPTFSRQNQRVMNICPSPLNRGKLRQAKRANERGANLTEFSAAIVILILGFLIPLLDLGVIPVHWLLSKEIVSNYVRKLALSETFSQAMTTVNTDPSLQIWLTQLGGVKTETINCRLVISRLAPPLETFATDKPHSIPAEWLPGGKKAPCSYEIELSVQAQFTPLIMLNLGIGEIPGLTTPFISRIEAKAPWENYGCNPITKQFFINE